jgi:hypothetical protein
MELGDEATQVRRSETGGGLDAMEGGSAQGSFYRARGGVERTGWRRSSV